MPISPTKTHLGMVARAEIQATSAGKSQDTVLAIPLRALLLTMVGSSSTGGIGRQHLPQTSTRWRRSFQVGQHTLWLLALFFLIPSYSSTSNAVRLQTGEILFAISFATLSRLCLAKRRTRGTLIDMLLDVGILAVFAVALKLRLAW